MGAERKRLTIVHGFQPESKISILAEKDTVGKGTSRVMSVD